jgi:hypothetical protein
MSQLTGRARWRQSTKYPWIRNLKLGRNRAKQSQAEPSRAKLPIIHPAAAVLLSAGRPISPIFPISTAQQLEMFLTHLESNSVLGDAVGLFPLLLNGSITGQHEHLSVIQSTPSSFPIDLIRAGPSRFPPPVSLLPLQTTELVALGPDTDTDTHSLRACATRRHLGTSHQQFIFSLHVSRADMLTSLLPCTNLKQGVNLHVAVAVSRSLPQMAETRSSMRNMA